MLYKNTILFAVAYIILYCTTAQDANAAVVVSLKPLGFIAAAITDGMAKTQVLLPNSASEHDYSLRPSDLKRLQSAELIVWIGPEMERFMQKPIGHLLTQVKQVTIAALDGVKPLLIKADACPESWKYDPYRCRGGYNMHLWLSPQIAHLSAVEIHDKLVELMPQSRAKLDANLKDFEVQLAAIDRQIGTELAQLNGKGYFVFHDAYSYYEKYYGLTPLGHFTVNPKIPLGARRLNEIRTQLLEKKAICVFTEPQFRPAIIKAVTRGTSIRTGTLDPLGINIQLSKASYLQLLRQLANQYTSCLKGD